MVTHVPITREGPQHPQRKNMISTYARTVSHRATKFGIATHIRQKRISSGIVTPYPKGAGPQRPLDFWGPLPLPTWFDVARQNWIVTHVTWGRSVFLGASHAPVTKERVLSVPRNFWDIYLRPNGLTLSDQIWYGIAHVGSSVFLGRQSRPVLKGGWAHRPKKLGILYMRAHSMRNSNWILHVYIS